MIDRSRDFFDFAPFIYLNCAYHGPLPRVAAEALETAATMRMNPAQIRNDYHFSFPDAYRQAVGDLIGCDAGNVAVTDSTTHGVTLLTEGLDWQDGDEVVIPEAEFPANKLPWLALEQRGVVVKQIDLGNGADAPERIERALTARTRIVSVAWVSYLDGRRLDLDPISALCRDRGVLFVIDASQGIGGLPFDLRTTPADLVACSGYKWLLGPYGLGFAYIRPELAERLRPRNVNWFSADGADDFNRFASLSFVFRPGAHRFDINETASFFNLAPGVAALRYVSELTPAAVEAHCRALGERLVAGLPAAFELLGADRPATSRSNILCLVGADESTTKAAFTRLSEAHITVSSRESSIRISPHVYNTPADIDRLLAVLGEASDAARPRRARLTPLPVGDAVSIEAAARPNRAALVGENLTLEPIDAARHGDDLFRASHGDPEAEAIWTYMPYGPFADAPAMARWLETCAAPEDPLFFAVIEHASGRAIGMVSYLRIAPEHRSIELGHIWYASGAQRTAVNTEAVLLLLREAFGRLGYRRVEWKCDALNRRSRRAALRLGFGFEGIFHQHLIVKGRNRDTAWFAMLEPAWPRIHDRLVGWLAKPAESRGRLGQEPSIAQRLHHVLGLADPTAAGPD